MVVTIQYDKVVMERQGAQHPHWPKGIMEGFSEEVIPGLSAGGLRAYQANKPGPLGIKGAAQLRARRRGRSQQKEACSRAERPGLPLGRLGGYRLMGPSLLKVCKKMY